VTNSSLDVSVVIPTRDRAALLRNALTAALGQLEVELEVIVVDDGSVDGTPELLSGCGEPRLRWVRDARPRGVAHARNRGIAEARGEWIAFLDDDDLWAPHKLRSQLDVASSEGAGWAYAAAIIVDEHARPIRTVSAPDPASVGEELLRFNAIPAGSSNVVARAELVRSLRGFDENLFHLADWDLWLRLASASRAAACARVLVAYREHSRNMLLDHRLGVGRELDYLLAKHRAMDMERKVDRYLVGEWIALAERRAGRRVRAASFFFRSGLHRRNPRNVAQSVRVLLGPRVKRHGRSLFAVRRRIDVPVTDLPTWLAASNDALGMRRTGDHADGRVS